MSTSLKSRPYRSESQPVTRPQPPGRRVSGKILAAFDHACLQNELAVAARLLSVYELILRRPPTVPCASHHRELADLVSAHERLWELRRSQNASDWRTRRADEPVPGLVSMPGGTSENEELLNAEN
jgi:hypothetical protein